MTQIEIGTKVWIRASNGTYRAESTVEKIYKNGKVKLSGREGMWTVTRLIEQREGTWTLSQPHSASKWKSHIATTDELLVAKTNDFDKRRDEKRSLAALIKTELEKFGFDNDHANSPEAIAALRSALFTLAAHNAKKDQ